MSDSKIERDKQVSAGFFKRNKRILLISFGISIVAHVIGKISFNLIHSDPSPYSEISFGAVLLLLTQIPGTAVVQLFLTPIGLIFFGSDFGFGPGDLISQIVFWAIFLTNMLVYGAIIAGVWIFVRKLRRK